MGVLLIFYKFNIPQFLFTIMGHLYDNVIIMHAIFFLLFTRIYKESLHVAARYEKTLLFFFKVYRLVQPTEQTQISVWTLLLIIFFSLLPSNFNFLLPGGLDHCFFISLDTEKEIKNSMVNSIFPPS